MGGVGRHLAVGQRDDPVVVLAGQLLHQFVLVRDHDHRDVYFVDGFEQLHDVHAEFGVDVAGRLVGNDELGAVGQRAGHRHALLLAAGKFVRQAVHLVLQPDQAEGERHAVLDGLGRDIGHAHGKRHVLVHGHGGDQAEVLEHHAHLAAHIGHFAPAQAGQVLAVDENAALGGLFLHQHQLEEGGFARAGMAEHKDEFAFLDVQADIVQRDVLVVLRLVNFGNVFKLDHGTPLL